MRLLLAGGWKFRRFLLFYPLTSLCVSLTLWLTFPSMNRPCIYGKKARQLVASEYNRSRSKLFLAASDTRNYQHKWALIYLQRCSVGCSGAFICGTRWYLVPAHAVRNDGARYHLAPHHNLHTQLKTAVGHRFRMPQV